MEEFDKISNKKESKFEKKNYFLALKEKIAKKIRIRVILAIKQIKVILAIDNR